jgi:hypothetical protein
VNRFDFQTLTQIRSGDGLSPDFREYSLRKSEDPIPSLFLGKISTFELCQVPLSTPIFGQTAFNVQRPQPGLRAAQTCRP